MSLSNSVSGQILKTEELESSSCLSGWLKRVKARHEIISGKVSSKTTVVNQNTVADWIGNV